MNTTFPTPTVPDQDTPDGWLVDAAHRLDADAPSDALGRVADAVSVGLTRTRQPGRDLATDSADVAVSDRIIRRLIVSGIRADLGRPVTSVVVIGGGDTIASVQVGLVADYREDLVADAERVRAVVTNVLVSNLGPATAGPVAASIAVGWDDLSDH